jgi:hypothetical protein
VTDLPLSLLGPYLASSGPQASADGTLSGVVAYRAPTADHGVLELDWLIRTLDMSVPLRAEPLHIESPRLELHSRIEIHPGRLRVAELKLEGLGGAGELTTRGVVERPLRESSRARLSTTLRGAGLAELRRIVAWLPETDATPLTELLARLESGRIERIEASGGARVSQWRRLARGELKSLPSGFVLTTDVAGVAVASDGPAALTDLGAHAEWSGDRISLRELSANWRGVPLARVDLTVEGLSNLLGGPASSRKLRPGAEPIPGLMTLWRILAGGPREGPAAPLPVMQLVIEALDHPGLRWPIRDTRVHIASTLRGVAIEASDGTWAGAPFRAEALWTLQPEPHWKVEVAVAAPASHPRSSPAGRPRENEIGSTDERADAWLRGELRVDSLEAAGLPTSKFEARFGLAGTSLSLSEVTAELMPEGVLTGGLVVDLSESERLPAKVDVQMLDGDLSQIAPMVGLEREQLSGRLSFRGGLEGWVAPERPLLTELSGSVYVQAREGELQREIPMVLAIAQATEGFNPFASRSVARFESVEMTLRLDRGRISTDNLELEGPIRAQAKGFLDIARPDPKVNVVVGVFLFRQADQTLGQLPLLSHLVSDDGLVGGYFEVDGSAADPEVRGLALDSIASAIPDVVKAPFRALRAIGRFLDGDADAPPPAKPSPDWPDSKDDWLRDIGRGS